MVAGLAFFAGYTLAGQRAFKIWYASAFFGSREHFLSCYDLPFYVQAEKIFFEHKGATEKIEGLGGFSVNLEKVICPGWTDAKYTNKAEVVVEYFSNKARKDIESFLGKDFFGLPYRIVKR